MNICGLQKTTLLDFPGHVAATVFLGGCNFRCPFCHNKDLLDNTAKPLYTLDELLVFFKKRASILEGVCISGGEPTLFPDELESLIREIRTYGYQIKLDTNGYQPQVLQHLCDNHLVDYVAMDIKTCPSRYSVVAGIPSLQTDNIQASVDYLMNSNIPYEFRTTVVKELHSVDNFIQIGQWLKGCSCYFLQNYVESNQVLKPGFSSYGVKELSYFADILRSDIPHVELRGLSIT